MTYEKYCPIEWRLIQWHGVNGPVAWNSIQWHFCPNSPSIPTDHASDLGLMFLSLLKVTSVFVPSFPPLRSLHSISEKSSSRRFGFIHIMVLDSLSFNSLMLTLRSYQLRGNEVEAKWLSCCPCSLCAKTSIQLTPAGCKLCCKVIHEPYSGC